MTIEEKNKTTMIRGNKEIVRKLKLVAAARGNNETIGVLIGSLVDKEIVRLGLKGNNND